MKLLSLNLNCRRRSVPAPHVADTLLDQSPDILAAVEYRESPEFLNTLAARGYRALTALDGSGRGVLICAPSTWAMEQAAAMTDPHLLHVRITPDSGPAFGLLALRILVGQGGDADFQDRARQWGRVRAYLETCSAGERARLLVCGDFNHGAHRADGQYQDVPRRFYNAEMVVSDLSRAGLRLEDPSGPSFLGYLKIDHLAVGTGVRVGRKQFLDLFPGQSRPGIPDHRVLLAEGEAPAV